MSYDFRAHVAPEAEVYAELSRVRSGCPFSTAAYADAWQRIGRRPCVLAVRFEGRIIEGCLGFIERRRLTRRLEIVSAPQLSQPDLFWSGVRAFCRSEGIWQLDVESFGSGSMALPTFDGEIRRRPRAEHVLDLSASDPFRGMSSNHSRNAARARKAGCVLVRATGAEGIATHAELMRSSLQRRQERGEAVTLAVESQFAQAILDARAGELYQVRRGELVLSSLLVLRSTQGAYYHSAGTSPEGMQTGASAFLIIELARLLRAAGTRVFNLGGAGDDEQGLRRFKSGFGTREVRLTAASFTISHGWVRKLRSAARGLREDPRGLLRRIVMLEHYVAFSARPEQVAASVEALPGEALSFRKLQDSELAVLTHTPDWRQQGERFQRLGWNAAYGLFVGSELVHIGWLIDAEQDLANTVRNLRLRRGEAEITHCLTSPAHRGRGYYRTMIRALCLAAMEKGIERVFMITGAENTASRAGIAKAGLRRCGDIHRYVLVSWASRPVSLTFRGHRWRRLG